MINTVILGSGIAGIGACYKLNGKAIIFEKNDRYGGLLDNFTINGFRFDYAIKLSFAKEKKLEKFLIKHHIYHICRLL